MSHNLSLSKLVEATTVVHARRSSWSRVTDTDEFNGRFSFVSRLPQYLMRAMFVGALHVTDAIAARGGACLVCWVGKRVWGGWSGVRKGKIVLSDRGGVG